MSCPAVVRDGRPVTSVTDRRVAFITADRPGKVRGATALPSTAPRTSSWRNLRVD
jgi:hypothetical protein